MKKEGGSTCAFRLLVCILILCVLSLVSEENVAVALVASEPSPSLLCCDCAVGQGQNRVHEGAESAAGRTAAGGVHFQAGTRCIALLSLRLYYLFSAKAIVYPQNNGAVFNLKSIYIRKLCMHACICVQVTNIKKTYRPHRPLSPPSWAVSDSGPQKGSTSPSRKR